MSGDDAQTLDDLSSYRPKERFGDRALEYARWRPAYPPKALDFILDGLPANELHIADIGAGTGISSRALAERGAHVVALDPNVAMVEAADPYPAVEYRHGEAERTGLPRACVDLVTAFQAFHWFERDAAMREFKRILKRPGRVAFVWNNRQGDDPFGIAYAQLMQSFGNEAAIVDRGANLTPPSVTLARHGFQEITQARFAHEQRLNLDGLIGRARSTSYLPREGDGYQRLLAALSSLHREFADAQDLVRFSYRTLVHRADLA